MFGQNLGTNAFGHKCIIDSNIQPYDACAEVEGQTPPSRIYNPKQWEYFGTGNIYEISGVFQGTGFGPYHFYRRISK